MRGMPATSKDLNAELVSLFSYVTRLRQEIASINRGQGGTEQFKSMSDQLDAIVEATEEATNTIMESMEGNENALWICKPSDLSRGRGITIINTMDDLKYDQ